MTRHAVDSVLHSVPETYKRATVGLGAWMVAYRLLSVVLTYGNAVPAFVNEGISNEAHGLAIALDLFAPMPVFPMPAFLKSTEVKYLARD